MKRILIAILLTLPFIAFAQGNSSYAPGKEKASGQSAKQFAPGQEKGSGQSAKQFAPGQQNKDGVMPLQGGGEGNKGDRRKNKY
ncbi:hypothetical protein [Polynucleobacter sp. MWH-UH23A]|uniref:hypothetical protein n=1 Tax=Polynucleobacter sp. MWH-UH23A TaxID=1855613 RepID=UPI00336518CD